MQNLNFLIIFVLCSLPIYSCSDYETECMEEEDEDIEYGDFFEGDMILNEEQLNLVFSNQNALTGESYRWPDATVIYQFSTNHSVEQNAVILEAMREIEIVSCLRFRSRTYETDYVQFEVSFYRIFPLVMK